VVLENIKHFVIKFIEVKKKWKEGTGPKVTVESFSGDMGININTFRYHLAKYKKDENGSKKKSKISKNDNPKRQNDKGGADATKKFDFDKMRTDFLYGNYPSVKAFAIHHGVESNNGYFRRKTAGWAKEKAILENERRKSALKDFRSESLSDTLEDIASIIKNIGKRMVLTLEYPVVIPHDIASKEKMVKMLCAVQDVELKQFNSLNILCQEKRRRELTGLYNRSEIDIQEFAGLMDLEGLPLTSSQMEALKAYYRNEPANDFANYDIAEIERQDEEEERLTRQKIEYVRREAELFKVERQQEVDELKKEFLQKRPNYS
jgi:hypothetical protein